MLLHADALGAVRSLSTLSTLSAPRRVMLTLSSSPRAPNVLQRANVRHMVVQIERF